MSDFDIETITQFKTTDGSLFQNLQNAEAHQVKLNLIEFYKVYQGGRPGGMGLEAFLDFLQLNTDLVRSYLDSLREA